MPSTNNPLKVVVKIDVKTREDVAQEYNVSIKVLNAHIEKHHIEIPPYTLLFPKQQKEIYEKLGYPPSVDRSLYENV